MARSGTSGHSQPLRRLRGELSGSGGRSHPAVVRLRRGAVSASPQGASRDAPKWVPRLCHAEVCRSRDSGRARRPPGSFSEGEKRGRTYRKPAAMSHLDHGRVLRRVAKITERTPLNTIRRTAEARRGGRSSSVSSPRPSNDYALQRNGNECNTVQSKPAVAWATRRRRAPPLPRRSPRSAHQTLGSPVARLDAGRSEQPRRGSGQRPGPAAGLRPRSAQRSASDEPSGAHNSPRTTPTNPRPEPAGTHHRPRTHRRTPRPGPAGARRGPDHTDEPRDPDR
jgi:hypothetical protein